MEAQNALDRSDAQFEFATSPVSSIRAILIARPAVCRSGEADSKAAPDSAAPLVQKWRSRVVQPFADGLSVCAEGCQRSFRTKSVRGLYTRYFVVMMLLLFPITLLGLLVLVPVYLVLMAADALLHMTMLAHMPSLTVHVTQFLAVLPLLGSLLIRTVFWERLEASFFETLATYDREAAAALRRVPIPPLG